MEHILAILGAVSGLISLLTIVYLAGYWKSKVDAKLKGICDLLQAYPPGETAVMVKTLWDIYVVDALGKRPDLAEHRSPYRLKKAAEDMIPPEVKEQLDGACQGQALKVKMADNIASGYLVVKLLGLTKITQFAEKAKLSVPEAIGILSTYLDEHCPHQG